MTNLKMIFYTTHTLFSPHLSNIITIINSVFWDVALCSSMNRS